MEAGLANDTVAASCYHPLCLLVTYHAGVLLHCLVELFLGIGPGCRWLISWDSIPYGLGPFLLLLGLRALPWVASSMPPWEGSAPVGVNEVREEVIGLLLHLALVAILGPHVCHLVRAE